MGILAKLEQSVFAAMVALRAGGSKLKLDGKSAWLLGKGAALSPFPVREASSRATSEAASRAPPPG